MSMMAMVGQCWPGRNGNLRGETQTRTLSEALLASRYLCCIARRPLLDYPVPMLDSLQIDRHLGFSPVHPSWGPGGAWDCRFVRV